MNIPYSAKAAISPLLLLVLVVISSNAFSDVYRWRDSKGVMQYSDVPPAAITKNNKSEAILLKVIKNESLCANPELTRPTKSTNDPISLNVLFKKVTTSLAQRSTSLTKSSTTTTTSKSSSTFQPIQSSTSASTPTGVSVATIGTQPTTTSTTTTPTSSTTTSSTSSTTTSSTSSSTTSPTSSTTTNSTSSTTATPTSTTTASSSSSTTTSSTSSTTTSSTSNTTTGYSTSTSLSSYPPKIAVSCGGNMETCTLPTGVTAKVWFGSGGSSGKWVSKENVTGAIGCNTSAMGDPQTGSYNRCFWVDNKFLAKDLDPKGANLMPAVNRSLEPKIAVGFSTPLIKSAPIPASDSTGAFRISCEYSHMSNDDPIVYPGVPNATHHHTFFGNTLANAYSTSESLHTTGNSTCAGGILNRSGYWMPSLINTKTGAPAKPSVVVVYYKGAGIGAQNIKTPPYGLRMIAGNAKPLAVADATGDLFCQDLNNNVAPHYGIKWKGTHIKDTCGGTNVFLRMIISFPQCWDGKNLDSPDHKSHMAYVCNDECLTAENKIGKTFNGCPATHPVLLPSIAINADFFDLDPTAKYRLASDNYSTTYPGGYSLHADWMNGWDETILSRVVKNCLNNPKDCGGPNLGDGQTLYGVNQD